MYLVKFDDLKRKFKQDHNIELKPLAQLHETSPEFEGWLALFDIEQDEFFQFCTEDDGKTHTFYRINLPKETSA